MSVRHGRLKIVPIPLNTNVLAVEAVSIKRNDEKVKKNVDKLGNVDIVASHWR